MEFFEFTFRIHFPTSVLKAFFPAQVMIDTSSTSSARLPQTKINFESITCMDVMLYFQYVLAYRALPLLITGFFNVGHYRR